MRSVTRRGSVHAMSQRFDPRGMWTAVVTPFDSNGNFDEARFGRLVDFQVAEGATGVVPCGTTGESPTLSWEEHERAVATAVRRVDGRAGVLAGTGSNSTAEAIRGTRDAKALGADAALLVDCYYNGPSSLELRTEYYERILEHVPAFPLVPYVIPGRTGCALEAADLAYLHLQAPEQVPAVKQATGNLDRMRQDRALAGDGLAIFSGDDELTLTMMADSEIRACGTISVMGNIVPRALEQMIAAQAAGDTETVGRLLATLDPLLKMVGCAVSGERQLPDGRVVAVNDKFRNPVPVKTMMAGLGMIEPVMRAPLGKMTAPAVNACREALRAVHAADSTVLAPIAQHFDVDVAQRLSDDALWSTLVR